MKHPIKGRKLHDDYENPIDSFIYKIIEKFNIVDIFYNIGFTPNNVTTISVIFEILFAVMFYKRKTKIAAVLFLVAYFFDCIDGYLARKYNMVSMYGDLYDHVSDVVTFTSFLVIFIKHNYKNNNMYLLLILAYLVYKMCENMGCTEKLYKKPNENKTLNKLNTLCNSDDIENRVKNHTRYFGCGTVNIFIAFLIYTSK